MKHYLRHTTLFLITLILSCGSGDTPIGQGGSPADSGGIAPRFQWDYRNDSDIGVAAGFSLRDNAPMKVRLPMKLDYITKPLSESTKSGQQYLIQAITLYQDFRRQ